MEQNNSGIRKLKFVLLVVLVLCGGNGAAIIAAALVWKATASLPSAILTLVVITLAALAGALAMILLHIKKSKRQTTEPAMKGSERNNDESR